MLTLNLDIIWTFINILVLFFLLKKFLFTPVTKMIEKRTAMIQDQLSAAKTAMNDAEKKKSDCAALLGGANAEADKIIKEAKARADRVYQTRLEQAEQDAKALVASAEKQIAKEKEQSMQKAKDEVADLVLAAAEKLTERSLDGAYDQSLLDELIREAGAAR